MSNQTTTPPPSQLEELKQGLEAFRKEQQQTNDTLNDIRRLLQGNPLDKTDQGLAGTVDAHDKRLHDLESWRSRAMAWIIGLSMGAGGGITSLIYSFYNHLKTSK